MERILNKLGTSLPYENVSYLLKDWIEYFINRELKNTKAHTK